MVKKISSSKIIRKALITIAITLASAFSYLLYLVIIGIPATQRHIESLAT